MENLEQVATIAELVWKIAIALGLLLSPAIILWGSKHFGSRANTEANNLRIQALEQEDLRIRQQREIDKMQFETRMAKCEEEAKAIARMDKRLFKVAVLLDRKFPEDAAKINLLDIEGD